MQYVLRLLHFVLEQEVRMGSAEIFVSWDNHQKTVCGSFEELLLSGTLVDCTIAAEGQYVKAHKLILSACSPYFQLLFNQENDRNPIVVLKDVKYNELKAVIDFVYRGKVNIPCEQLTQFLEVAKSLEIKGLAHFTEKSEEEFISAKGSNASRTSPYPRKRRRNISSVDDNAPSLLKNSTSQYSEMSAHAIPLPSSVPKLPSLSWNESSNLNIPDQACNITSDDSWMNVQSVDERTIDFQTVIKAEPDPELGELSEVCFAGTKTEEYDDANAAERDETHYLEDPVGSVEAQDVVDNYVGPDHQMPEIPQYSGRGRRRKGMVRKGVCGKVGYVCAFCHRAFVTPSKLERHMRTHTGERPFVCHICGNAFKDPSSLKLHSIAVHSEADRGTTKIKRLAR